MFKDDVLKAYKIRRSEGFRPKDALVMAKHDAKYGERSKKRDLMPSRYEAYAGEEVTELPNGWKIKVEFHHDSDSGPPWKECDGMGVIEESPRYWGDLHESYRDWRMGEYHYFDWKATLPIAIKEGWDSKPYGSTDKQERAMRAMRSTYEYLRRWCDDQWWYVGMIVILLDEDDTELAEESCWRYESDAMDHLTSEARSWAAHMIVKERRERRESLRQARIASRFHDAMECGL